MPSQRLQLEIEEFVNIERAGFVGFVEMAIARFVDLPIEHFLFDEELRPFEIAVSCQERVIQIEQGEAHGGAKQAGGDMKRRLQYSQKSPRNRPDGCNRLTHYAQSPSSSERSNSLSNGSVIGRLDSSEWRSSASRTLIREGRSRLRWRSR